MHFISTRVHGFLDYLLGVFLILLPWLGAYPANRMETVVPEVIGIIIIAYSLFTDYEWGLSRLMPMTSHLGTELVVGAVLMISPWLFDFSERIWLPHFLLGLLTMTMALTSQTETESERRPPAVPGGAM